MGLLSTATQIGRSAVMTYQATMDVVGNNVANAGNTDYTRQTSELAARPGIPIASGDQPGAGVAMAAVKRNVDESLEDRLRVSIADYNSSYAQSEWVSRMETYFDDLGGAGISSQLNDFFNNLSEVQNSPEDTALRAVAISSATTLTDSLQRLRGELVALGEEIDSYIGSIVREADSIATQIEQLNTEIVAAEAEGNSSANSLRDQRDAMLRDLAESFDVTTREQEDGSIYVYLGSEPLVLGGISRGLTTDIVLDGDYQRTQVRFNDTGAQVPITSGRVEGLITARETQAYGLIDELDTLAAGLITEFNKVHANGQGMTPMETYTAFNAVRDTTVPLNNEDSGLSIPPTTGSFFMVVTDETTNTPTAYQINIDLDGLDDNDTTLDSLVADINATVDGVTASLTTDNRLVLNAGDGRSFSFGYEGSEYREDTSGILASLGINTFFTGSTAGDIEVNSLIVENPARFAAATDGLIGDGQNAGNLANVLNNATDMLGGTSVRDYYNRVANDVANIGADARSGIESTEAVLNTLTAQRESISGVSLDEEAINLMKYEKAFQGASRYLSTVNQMLTELLSIIR